MRINKRSIVALVAIFITIIIMVTVYRMADKTDVIPKSATLVRNIQIGSFKNA